MLSHAIKMTVSYVCLVFFLSCAHVNYVGNSYQRTDHVEIYFSPDEITKEYQTIGHAISAGQAFVSMEKLQLKLIEEAQSRGADAILIKEVDRDSELNGAGFDAEKQLKATFIRYK